MRVSDDARYNSEAGPESVSDICLSRRTFQQEAVLEAGLAKAEARYVTTAHKI